MPADKKYLSSPLQRLLKISAGIVGGYLIAILLHNAIGTLLTHKNGLIVTSAYTSFLVWASLLVIAFLAKNGWVVWAVYLLLILLLTAIIFLNK